MSDVTEAMLEGLDVDERKAAVACEFKHTKYQPTTDEFVCPKCGASCGGFGVDDSPNYDCPLIHVDDGLVCYGKDGKGCPSQYGVSGQGFATMLVKRKNLKPCPHCKGKGYV